MSRDAGYGLVVAVSDAIEAATASWERDDPTAFRYRGADLRHAVERGLYVGLSNNASLSAAYRDGRPASEVDGLGSALEAAVAARLLGARADRPRWRRWAAQALWRARDLRDVRPPPADPGLSGPVAFVVGHRKLLRFLEPVRRCLRDADRLVVVTAADVAAPDEPGAVEEIAEGFVRAPAARAVGVGLLGAAPLLGVYDALLDVLARHRPRAVLVAEGMSPVDELANRAAHAVGIPCLCLQQGWSPFVHVGFRNMTFDAMAVWGDGFADLLRPHNPQQRFVAAGSFVLGADVSDGRDELASTVGDRPGVAFFLQPDSPIIGPAHQAALRELMTRTAARLPECAILVREHPAAPLPSTERGALAAAGMVLAEPRRFALRAVLDVAEVAVSIYSTSLIEAAALGVVPVVFNPTSMPRYSPDLEALGAGLERRSVSDAEEAIAVVVRDIAARERLRRGGETFRARFFAQDGSPAERILALLSGQAH